MCRGGEALAGVPLEEGNSSRDAAVVDDNSGCAVGDNYSSEFAVGTRESYGRARHRNITPSHHRSTKKSKKKKSATLQKKRSKPFP